jgi:hypothetical protein
MRKVFWLMCFVFCFWVRTASAQDAVAVTLATGLSDSMYQEGVHTSDAPVIVPVDGLTARGVTVDISNLTDPAVCVTVALERSDDGVTWTVDPDVSGGLCGNPRGFRTSAAVAVHNSGDPLPEGVFLRSAITVAGGSVQTNSAILMWTGQ